MLSKEYAEQAKKHTEEMEKRYPQEIAKCVKESRFYDDSAFSNPREAKQAEEQPRLLIWETDSVSAAARFPEGRTAVLNFADYYRAGGLFLRGSHAQEEALCHASFLYNILTAPQMKEYYRWNKAHMNRNLYLNRAIYTPGVLFRTGEKGTARLDVLTCAAPYSSKARKKEGVSEQEVDEILQSRIRFIREILEKEQVHTAILGAYGCGVFGNDPETVAETFFETFSKSSLQNVVFAIPGGKNLRAFNAAFTYAEKAAVKEEKPAPPTEAEILKKYPAGFVIHHPKYGDGTVVGAEENSRKGLLKVRFGEAEKKIDVAWLER